MYVWVDWKAFGLILVDWIKLNILSMYSVFDHRNRKEESFSDRHTKKRVTRSAKLCRAIEKLWEKNTHTQSHRVYVLLWFTIDFTNKCQNSRIHCEIYRVGIVYEISVWIHISSSAGIRLIFLPFFVCLYLSHTLSLSLFASWNRRKKCFAESCEENIATATKTTLALAATDFQTPCVFIHTMYIYGQ